jgi:hypothetical protein
MNKTRMPPGVREHRAVVNGEVPNQRRVDGAAPLFLPFVLWCAVGSLGPAACTRHSEVPRVEAVAAAAATAEPLLAKATTELELLAALPIEIADDFQPSGLLSYEEHLLTVSDKHDAAVYELEMTRDKVRLVPFITFEPPADEPAPLDFEGLSADADGTIFLISESRFRVLALSADGSRMEAPREARARWVTPSLQAKGLAGGCFQVPGGYFEGMVWLPSGGLLLAAERQPRGLIQLGAELSVALSEVWAMPDSTYPIPHDRNADFADLSVAGSEVYALVRNAHLIVQMIPTKRSWQEGRAFSYAAAENDPRYAYANRQFGLGEGVAIGKSEIFVVLDNNGQARAADSSDKRPVLFVFARPEDL